MVYDLNACGERNVGFNANRAAWEITAGLKYHFRCSNGKHHISFAKLYDQAEVDALNEQVNNLRQTNVDQEAELTAANQRNAELEQQLADCKNQGPVIVTDIHHQPQENIGICGNLPPRRCQCSSFSDP